MTRRRSVLMLALACILISAPAVAVAQVGYPGTNYYTPLFYDGYIVYFDAVGRPYIYVEGGIEYGATTHARFHSYVTHWRAHRLAYARWYRGNGVTYHHWRLPGYNNKYRPMYHDGYVVYYSTAGLPFYYLGGRTMFVPRTSASYNRFASHYRINRTGYARWNKASGTRQRSYRQPAANRTRVATRRAPTVAVRTRTPAMTPPRHRDVRTNRTPAMKPAVRRSRTRSPAMAAPSRRGAPSRGMKR